MYYSATHVIQNTSYLGWQGWAVYPDGQMVKDPEIVPTKREAKSRIKAQHPEPMS